MSAFAIPDLPSKPTAVGEARTRYRYEDVAQDGRLRIEGIWPSMGRVLWEKMDIAKVLARLGMKHGIRNVLTRVVVESRDEPITTREPSWSRVCCRLEHAVDESGAVSRLLFNTWLETEAPRRASAGPVSFGTGEMVLAARAYGQHVLTRPLERPPDHRVLALDDPELPAVPPHRGVWLPPEDLLALPDGARPLEEAPRPDAAPIVFGLAHTDGNRHVNFLTYPRLVEDAALRRLADLGVPGPLLARRAELGYRKPCFAGDRLRLVCRAFRASDRFGVVAAFVPDRPDLTASGDWAGWGQPHCTARMLLSL